MAIYIFQNPQNENDIIEIIMSVNDSHEFSKDGIKWNRIFTVPNASVSSSTNLNPNDSKAFVELTKNKKGSYGDLLDLSKELSQKREKQMGKDAIREQNFKEYSDKRNGKIHPIQRKEKLDKLKKEGIKLKLK